MTNFEWFEIGGSGRHPVSVAEILQFVFRTHQSHKFVLISGISFKSAHVYAVDPSVSGNLMTVVVPEEAAVFLSFLAYGDSAGGGGGGHEGYDGIFA